MSNLHSAVLTAGHFPVAGPARRSTAPSRDRHRFPAAGPARHLTESCGLRRQLPHNTREEIEVPG